MADANASVSVKAEPIAAMAAPSAPPQAAAAPAEPSPPPGVMIMGYSVAFPEGKKPFPAQLAVMNKVLMALKTGQHALLESPTGSGKTLALLCSSLTFQKAHVKELLAAEQERKQQEQQQVLAKAQQQALAQVQVEAQAATTAADAVAVAVTAGRAPEAERDDDLDDDFASTQPSFDQFRFHGSAKAAGDGWISMGSKRKQKDAATKSGDGGDGDDDDDFDSPPDPPLKRKLPDSFTKAGAVGSKPPLQAPPSRKRKLPPSFTSTLAGSRTNVVEDLESFHDTGASNGSNNSGGVSGKSKRVLPPKIFFCSRTHSQLSQVVDELKNCPVSYLESPDKQNPYSNQLKTVVLGSKSHFCVNSKVNRDPSQVDDKCRTLLDNNGCSFFRKRKKQNDLRKVAPPVWDIEDLVKLAKKHRECAFFHTRDALVDANIVFCPYNYLLDPSIRDAVGITLKNSIIVLDEAHNVEDTCRSSASIEVTSDLLAAAITSFTNRWLKWVESTSGSTLKPSGFEEESNVWSGMDCVAILDQYGGVNADNFASIKRDVQIVVEYERELSDNDGADAPPDATAPDGSNSQMLTTLALSTVRSILNVADYMLREDLKYVDDFKLIVIKSRAANARFTSRFRGSYTPQREGWQLKLCIWCLNAAVAFSDVAREARSVILTSGTLSPMESFAGELGAEFPIRLEANHVVNMRKQVFVGAILNGPGQVDLSSTYKNQQEFRYQDAMGQLLLEYSKRVPGGILMFFPSYSLMDKLSQRWKQTGVWNAVEQAKRLFTEPRQAGKDFDALMDEYKTTITLTGKASLQSGEQTGAVFLAVYRGKVSEGIDFSNDNARAVLAVGIPYPSFKELQVQLKRKYQDEKSATDKRLVNGSTWYQLQAFRALNQALGRCIRHRQDYGMIMLLDSRHRAQAHVRSLSKWMRPFVREFEHPQQCLPLLPAFFERNEAEFGRGQTKTESAVVTGGTIALSYERNDGERATNQRSTPPRKRSPKQQSQQPEEPMNAAALMQQKMTSVRAFMEQQRAEGGDQRMFSLFHQPMKSSPGEKRK
ncbi:TPA: hypothetical protein N0F65_009200 [Lagenidium giganteum]|uniref:Helicase ATP-binding domain-containing protein n=1 Tax=Lagenidium giganteum TaxID=4803 RepID=A0AAV2YT57_9STRA|nr:TPA: hypothetical protein N0F65_009200 [Lagenidium giganteum]